MSSDDFVIEVEHLEKHYQIFDTPQARLRQFLGGRARQLVGLKPRRYYRDFRALDDVSFVVRKGETVGIVGRNGSGKSTLLQLICGTLFPSSGEVRTHGRIAALLELGSGFNPEFTGRENVYLNAAILGVTASQIDERFHLIEQFADIGDFIDQPIKIYSSGMVVRLAFATAIHVDPDILVVDEALAVGDVAFQQKCLDRIRQLQRSGVSILLVTHSTNALIEYCDRAIFLKHGKVMMDGTCREVVKAYADDLVLDEGGVALDSTAGDELSDGWAQIAPTPEDGENEGNAPMAVESIALIDPDGRPCPTVAFAGSLRVRVKIRVDERVAEPCFGIQLSSVDGISLWGATTQGMGVQLPPLDPGMYCYEWELQTPFSGNRYIIAIGVGHIANGEYRRMHRVSYAGYFDVLAQPHSGAGWLAPSPVFRAPATVAA